MTFCFGMYELVLEGVSGYSGILWVPIFSATSFEQRTMAVLDGM
jgi:hypothetical protein